MNYKWRITKYNPLYRDSNGIYCKNEWTSYSDIGKVFDGIELTSNEYNRYENLYINAIIILMDYNKVDKLCVSQLEKYDDCNDIENGMMLLKEQIKVVVSLILKEKIWCKLELYGLFYVHFGYDYNMYVGSNYNCYIALDKIMKSNLYIEFFKSPYLD